MNMIRKILQRSSCFQPIFPSRFRDAMATIYQRKSGCDRNAYARTIFTKEATKFRLANKDQTTLRQYSKFRSQTGFKKGTSIVALGFLLLGVSGTVWYQYGYCDEEEETANLESRTQRGKKLTLDEAIKQARDLAQRIKDETGSPGLVIGVSVDGQRVWSEGLGYADLENRVKCTQDTIFRIASISKTITMAAVAREWEAGKLDLDKPVQHYVPDFPEKTFDGKKVTITTRQLVSHLSGIRGYDKGYMQKKNKTKDEINEENTKTKSEGEKKGTTSQQKPQSAENQKKKTGIMFEEYYIKDNYSSVAESLKLFKDDPLVRRPNEKYLYTTHGFTLISAVLEGATKQPFEKLIQTLFQDLDLSDTYLEEHTPLIYNRGRHYIKNERGRIINAPYVDLSYKWAGGGLISNVKDLLKFGNAMLYSFQYRPVTTATTDVRSLNIPTTNTPSNKNLTSEKSESEDAKVHSEKPGVMEKPGFLKPETVEMLWKPVILAYHRKEKIYYAMGWDVIQEKYEYGCCKHQRFITSHTGGAMGASSVLMILHAKGGNPGGNKSTNLMKNDIPNGVVVGIIINISSVNLEKTALDIAQIFENVHVS